MPSHAVELNNARGRVRLGTLTTLEKSRQEVYDPKYGPKLKKNTGRVISEMRYYVVQ